MFLFFIHILPLKLCNNYCVVYMTSTSVYFSSFYFLIISIYCQNNYGKKNIYSIFPGKRKYLKIMGLPRSAIWKFQLSGTPSSKDTLYRVKKKENCSRKCAQCFSYCRQQLKRVCRETMRIESIFVFTAVKDN